MKRFQNILYLADTAIRDTTAFERAVALAIQNKAQLTVLAVRAPLSDANSLESDWFELFRQALDSEMSESIEALTSLAAARGLTIGQQSRLGEPFIEAIHAVRDEGYDLLIKSANPPEGTMEQLFGGTDHHVLRKCPCPVWIEPAKPRGRYSRILAAIDPLASEDGALHRTILQLATSMALRQDADLHVVHAWRLPGESMFLSGRTRIPEERLEALTNELEATHRAAFEAALEPFEGICRSITPHLLKSGVSEAILSTIETESCDLLIMGTVGRVGMPGLFISNTAEEVLGTLPCAVMAVKPEGFKSPVQ